MRRFLLFLVVLTGFLPHSVAAGQDLVRAEGMASIVNNRVDIARDRAIDSAQRNAVERVVGVMISSSTEVENFQVKMDRILSESKGFITSYKILKEERERDVYEVHIEAVVETGRLKDRLEAVQLIMARKSKPRLMILFNEQAQKDAIAEAAMARYFMAQGFKLVDADVARKNRDVQAIQATAERQQLTNIAKLYGAEVLILGRVEVASKSFKMGDVEIQSNEVAVSGKVVNGDTGEILASDSKSRKGEFKTVTEDTAIDLAKQMKEEILERWSSELTNTVTVKLVVSGLNNYKDLSRFKEILNTEIRGLKELQQRSYARGQVELDLEVKGNTQNVADDLSTIMLNQKKFLILEITQNTIKASLSPKKLLKIEGGHNETEFISSNSNVFVRPDVPFWLCCQRKL
jgi:DNA-binding cell septation regulator SpoVG